MKFCLRFKLFWDSQFLLLPFNFFRLSEWTSGLRDCYMWKFWNHLWLMGKFPEDLRTKYNGLFCINLFHVNDNHEKNKHAFRNDDSMNLTNFFWKKYIVGSSVAMITSRFLLLRSASVAVLLGCFAWNIMKL